MTSNINKTYTGRYTWVDNLALPLAIALLPFASWIIGMMVMGWLTGLGNVGGTLDALLK